MNTAVSRKQFLQEKIEVNRRKTMNLINYMYDMEKAECVENNQPYQDLGDVTWINQFLGDNVWNVVYLNYSAEQSKLNFVFQKGKKLYSGGVRFKYRPWKWFVNYASSGYEMPFDLFWFLLHTDNLNFTRRSYLAIGRLLAILQSVYDREVVPSFVNKGAVYGIVPVEVYDRSLTAPGYPVFIKDGNRATKFTVDVAQV